jgi:hypothetical protein
MDLINKDFMEYLDKFIMESINNIFVYSSSKEEHLCLVLQKLQNHRPYAKLSKLFGWSKCLSWVTSFQKKEYLWVQARFEMWNAPVSVADIRSSLGLVGYYHRFIEGISKITKPMTKLLEKDKKFKWTSHVKLVFRSWRSN